MISSFDSRHYPAQNACALSCFLCVLILVLILLIPSVYVYCRNAFFMVHGPFGDVDTYNIDYIYDTFGKGALMDSYIMDFVIKYWKQDPELGLAYQSGERLLLSPLFITVNVCCHSFLLHWAFSCPCLLALFILFFHVLFLFFFVCSTFFKWKPL